MKKTHITPKQKRELASLCHVLILDGLSTVTTWSLEDVKFQGGTSLALAWNSPRFSEDLDFVARSDLNFIEEMNKVLNHVERGLQKDYSGAKVGVRNNSDKNNQNLIFIFDISLPNVLGKVKVKSEFWQVNNESVIAYDGAVKTLARRGDINPLFPVATMKQIFADKMVALGGRDRLKWRDLFDLWYIDTHESSHKILNSKEEFNELMENTLSLYDLSPSTLNLKWANLLQKSNEEIIKMAETDLKQWLSEDLWNKLYPHEIENMVISMKEKLAIAINIFPPKEYENITSVDFKKIIANKRREQKNVSEKNKPSI